MKNNKLKWACRDLARKDISPQEFRVYEKIHTFLVLNPKLKDLSYHSLHRILILKNEEHQVRVIKKITDLIIHPRISDYRVMETIQSLKGEDIDG